MAAAAPADLASLTLKKAADLIRSKGASPVELTQACLKRIEQYNSKLNAFITVIPEPALAAARDMEADQQRGKWRGPLHGVPIALKDNIDTAGVRSTGASELFKDRVPSEDAEVARRLSTRLTACTVEDLINLPLSRDMLHITVWHGILAYFLMVRFFSNSSTIIGMSFVNV